MKDSYECWSEKVMHDQFKRDKIRGEFDVAAKMNPHESNRKSDKHGTGAGSLD